jgi:hypothetical protein
MADNSIAAISPTLQLIKKHMNAYLFAEKNVREFVERFHHSSVPNQTHLHICVYCSPFLNGGHYRAKVIVG